MPKHATNLAIFLHTPVTTESRFHCRVNTRANERGSTTRIQRFSFTYLTRHLLSQYVPHLNFQDKLASNKDELSITDFQTTEYTIRYRPDSVQSAALCSPDIHSHNYLQLAYTRSVKHPADGHRQHRNYVRTLHIFSSSSIGKGASYIFRLPELEAAASRLGGRQ